MSSLNSVFLIRWPPWTPYASQIVSINTPDNQMLSDADKEMLCSQQYIMMIV